jgi:hypothetical protein
MIKYPFIPFSLAFLNALTAAPLGGVLRRKARLEHEEKFSPLLSM